jgi:hypothetical protein
MCFILRNGQAMAGPSVPRDNFVPLHIQFEEIAWHDHYDSRVPYISNK